MAVGVNRERGDLLTLIILYSATSTHNHLVSDCYCRLVDQRPFQLLVSKRGKVVILVQD